MPDLQSGIRMPVRSGCEAKTGGKAAEASSRQHLKGEEGFIDIGAGTRVRIGGRVRMEAGFSR